MIYDREVIVKEIRLKFKDLFDHSLDLIYVNDLEGNFLDANDLTLLALGYERKEIPDIKFLNLLDEFDLRNAFRVLKEILKTGKQSKREEYKIKAKNGNFINIETYGIPVKRNGKIQAIIGIGKNITDRKKAEQKLKDSEGMFRTLYKEGPIATYTWKKYENDFILINFNNSAEKLTHGNVANLLGNKASDMYKDRGDIISELHKCYDEKTHITREMKYRFQFNNEEKFLLVNYGYVKPDLIIIQTEDITDKRVAEEKLRESETKYRNMIDNLDISFYQVTLSGILLTHNPAYNKILGFELSEDLKNTKVTDLWQYPEIRDVYLNQIMKENFVHGYICHALKKNGEKIVLELNSHLIKDNEGNPIRIDGTFLDITEKFTLERGLRESEEKFRNIAEQSLIGIAILQSGKFKYINQRFAVIAGRTEEEMKDWGPGEFINFVHPDDRQMVAEQARNKQIGEEDVITNYLFRGYKKTGELIYGEIYSKTIKYQGEYADFITFLDITDKVEAEKKFIESEKKYKFVYDNTPFSIVLIDSGGKIIDCNPTTEVLFGYLKLDLIGKQFQKLKVVHPDYLPDLVTLFKKFIKGEKAHRIDLKMYKKDGSLIWVSLQASLINLNNEYYIQALFTDIRKRKEAEFLVNKEIMKMKELEKMRKNLISIVAHELKTPLASVCGGTELLITVYGKDLEEEALELTSLIEKGGKRLTKLVNSLIDISRIDYDKFELKKQPNDLCKLISESTKEMKYLLERSKLTLNLNLPSPIILNLDKNRIKEVFFNLLSNAIKNTPPNGKINITVELKDNDVIINVADSGIGLTPDEMDIIFTRFGKIERFGEGLEYINIQGSGLGLYISKEIISSHNGKIMAESEGRNKGSSFIVKLPIT